MVNALRSYHACFTRSTRLTSNDTMAPALNDATNCLDVDDAQDGFEELLIAFNPYVEELLHQPAFHPFMTLPAVRVIIVPVLTVTLADDFH